MLNQLKRNALVLVAGIVAAHATVSFATASFAAAADVCRSTKYFNFGTTQDPVMTLDCTYAGCDGSPGDCKPRVITPGSGNQMKVCNCKEGGALDSCCQVVVIQPGGEGDPYPDVDGDCVTTPCTGSGACTLTESKPGEEWIAECLAT